MFKKVLLTASFLILGAGVAFGAGKHEGLECTGCHNIHYAKGPIIFDVAPNAKGMPSGASASSKLIAPLCLGCHSDPDKGGMGILPVSAHTSHPWGRPVNKKVANVPDALLRDGIMDCVSCHDPHPSNNNYKYLRVDTNGGKDMQGFCILCHPAKADKAARAGVKMFNSMNEETGATNTTVSGETSAAPTMGEGTARPVEPVEKKKKK